MRSLSVTVALTILIAFGSSGRSQSQTNPMASKDSIARVLAAHQDSLMTIPGVVGVGEGKNRDSPVVLVLVKKKTAQLTRRIPKTLGGYPVVIKETGIIRPMPKR